MVNINLARTALEPESVPERRSNIGLLVIFGVVIAVLAFYGWIYLTSSNLDKELAEIDQRINTEKSKLVSSDDNKAVVNFQNRLLHAQSLLGEKNESADSLRQIAKKMIPEAFLSSYDFDQTTRVVSIEGIADDFNFVARQLASFKESDYFINVTGGDSAVAEKNKVSFSMKMTIK